MQFTFMLILTVHHTYTCIKKTQYQSWRNLYEEKVCWNVSYKIILIHIITGLIVLYFGQELIIYPNVLSISVRMIKIYPKSIK